MVLEPKNFCCGLCQIVGRLTCPLSRRFHSDSVYDNVSGDNCCMCNMATFDAFAPTDQKHQKIIYASCENELVCTPFLVLIDEQHKSVVVTVQGSSSLADAFTDVLVAPSLIWQKLSEDQKKKLGENSQWRNFKGTQISKINS